MISLKYIVVVVGAVEKSGCDISGLTQPYARPHPGVVKFVADVERSLFSRFCVEQVYECGVEVEKK